MTHIVFLFSLFLTIPDLNKKVPFYFLTFSILFLFLSLRFGYGNDYFGYYQIHSAINSGLPAWGDNDILFKYLNLIIPNFYMLIAIVSLFYMISIYKLITNNIKIKHYWYSVLFLLINPYLFLVHLSGIRQTIAICFVTFAILALLNRKLFLYFMLIILAAGFHQSAIILLPLYFIINNKKLTKIQITSVFSILVLLLATPLLDIILIKAFEYFPEYQHYYEQELQNSLRSTLITGFFVLFILFNINKLEGSKIIYAKLSLIGTIISLLAFKVSMISRVGMYFEIFLILTLPHILLKIKTKAYRILLFTIIVLIYLLRYFSFFNNPMWGEHYNIYRTILSI